MGVRDTKKAQTRADISAAVRSLVADGGYDATTVESIAARACVSRATFFRYFATKEAAFFADQQGHLDAFEAELAALRRDEEPLDAVRKACMATAAAYVADKDVRLAQHRIIAATPGLSSYDQQLDARWERAIASTLGEQFVGPDARAAAGAIVGVMRAVVRDWFEGDCRGDLLAVGERSFALLADGLRAHSRR